MAYSDTGPRMRTSSKSSKSVPFSSGYCKLISSLVDDILIGTSECIRVLSSKLEGVRMACATGYGTVDRSRFCAGIASWFDAIECMLSCLASGPMDSMDSNLMLLSTIDPIMVLR